MHHSNVGAVFMVRRARRDSVSAGQPRAVHTRALLALTKTASLERMSNHFVVTAEALSIVGR